ncbi:MAG: hypothetical protein KGJ60_14375 [Verrucomicrobiota bacterium]|nr:hypothetical protein [Verrucomicrobiota bacterium]
MSVRAYKVLEMRLDRAPSFNCWHDEKLMEFFDGEGIWDGRNSEGSGTMEVSVAVMRKALANAQRLELDEFDCEAIKADLAWARKKGQDYIRYECF